MAPPAFASGPMHVDHIPGRPIVLGHAGYEFACPGCAFDFGKANKEGKGKECLDILYIGLHVENRKVFERPDIIKPFSTPLTTYNTWAEVPGRSIRIKSALASSFNVVCPLCAYYLGNDNSMAYYNIIAQGNHINHSATPVKEEDAKKEDDSPTTDNTEKDPKKENDSPTTNNTEKDPKKENNSPTTNNKDDETTKDNEGKTEANKKRTTAVMGNEGVAGIKIEGEEIDVEIEAPPANPTTKSTVTLIAPIKADDVVANNYGVAGIDLKGTGKVKLVIGKSTK